MYSLFSGLAEPVGALIRLDTKELQARAVKTKRAIGNL